MSLGPDYFARQYAGGDDPWGFRDRWYERRKRDLTMAALPRERFGTAFEPGCAIGELSARLAERCGSVLATDVDDTALSGARERLARLPQVTLERRALPAEWPDGRFDLVVLSEVAYYLDPPDLRRLAALAAAGLGPDGVLVACHWQHPVADYPTTGAQVHAALSTAAQDAGLVRLVRHVEEDLLLEVWARDGRSVARREGLV